MASVSQTITSEAQVKRCLACKRLSTPDFVSDVMTGTVYEKCGACGALRLSSPTGFVDWKGGMWVDDGRAAGSAWTQSVGTTLLPERSRLSTTSVGERR